MKKYCTIGLLCYAFMFGTAQAGNSYQQVQNQQKAITIVSGKRISLTAIFNEMAKQSGYSFIFSEQLIKDFYADELKINQLELNAALKYLENRFPVAFKVSNRSVAVVVQQKKQEQTSVKGLVTDEKGEGIPGISVKEKGTKSAAVTDARGNFKISTDQAEGVLIFSYIGYNTLEKSFSASTSVLNVQMKENVNTLSDVVVVGYGTQKKSSVTGSISSLKAEDLTGYAGGTLAEAVVGKAAGVQIVQNSASPGAGSQIKIRGTGTLTAGTAPLVVVDGFPLTEGSSLSALDPNVIKSIEILKDAASTAIYGSRGANGVIMVETKQGKEGKTSVSFNSYYGIQQRADNVKLVDAYEMAQFMLEARNTGYVSKDPLNRKESDDASVRLKNGASKRELIPDYILPYLQKQPGLQNTNWLDEVFKNAPMMSHTLNVSGGDLKSKYSVTGNYFKQDGIVIGSNFERYSSNINITSALTDKIKFGITLNPSYSKRNIFDNTGDWSTDPLAIAMISYPFFSVYNSKGELNISDQIKTNLPTDGALSENPIAMMRMIDNKTNEFKMFGNSYLSVNFLKDFTFKTSLGGDFSSYNANRFDPSDVGRYRQAAPDKTEATRRIIFRKNYLNENVLSFNKSLGKHTLDVIAGQSFQYEYIQSNETNAFDFPDDQVRNISGGTSFSARERQEEWTLISYFSRVNYNYDNRYLLAASVRRDGSSRFGDNSKWSLFPAVSLGWLLSEETFFNKSNPYLNYLKLRAGWGRTGNNQIPNYGAKSLLFEENYVNNGVLGGGYRINTAPNPNLSWEVAESINLGLDMSLINNYFSLSADYYVSNTNDLLLNVPVPLQSGYSTSIQNIGKIRNWGFELQLGLNKAIMMGEFKWRPSVNFSTNKNKVLALGNGQNEILTGTNSFARTRVGGPIAEMYGYKVTGVYRTAEELNNSPKMAGTLVGDYIIADLNGDGIIDSKDKMGFGTAAPEISFGFSSSLSYKGFDLSFVLSGELGKKIYSRPVSTVFGSGEGFAVASKEYFDHRFHPVNNPDGRYATPNMGNFSNNRKETRASNIFFDNASYLRLRTLRLAYQLPTSFVKRIGLSGLQVYLSSNNLFTITPYKGFSIDATSLKTDPNLLKTGENSEDPLTQGYDNANYPVAKSYVLGLNLNF
ncbi:SusC/RagA family TonB-linked outer membrane protein [Pedobacter caeni]|nr:TonB-dependent receptor [Pedobacter caeni]